MNINLKSLGILASLLMVSNVAQAVKFKVVNMSDTIMTSKLSGGSHGEAEFSSDLNPQTTWTGQRDCTGKVTFWPRVPAGQVELPSFSVELSDQRCKTDWMLTIRGNGITGYIVRFDDFQNDCCRKIKGSCDSGCQ
jgi:hypothetical protein